MRKYLVATLFTVLCVCTILPASATPTYVAADNFTRSTVVLPGWGTSENSVSATNYAWAGDLASDAGASVQSGFGLALCHHCTVGEAFSGTLGPSHAGGTATLVFENLYAVQQISVAENATSDLATAYLARVNYANGKLEIVKRVSSSDTVLSSTPLPRYKKIWMTVSLTVNGGALSATAQYSGGSSVSTSATDGSALGSGSAGVYFSIATAKWFDELLVDSFSAAPVAV